MVTKKNIFGFSIYFRGQICYYSNQCVGKILLQYYYHIIVIVELPTIKL